MLHHFDHRYGDYRDQPEGSENTHLPDVPLERLQDPSYTVQPRYWVPATDVEARLAGRWNRSWLLTFRNVARSTDERTTIASVLPLAAVGHSAPVIINHYADVTSVGCFLGNLSTFVLDYVVRQKLGGINMTFGYVNQFAVLPPEAYDRPCPWESVGATHASTSPLAGPEPGARHASPLRSWIAARVLELTYTAWDLQPFARDLGYDGPPFVWDEARRFLLRCELDAAFFHLYGIARDDVDYIMETFPIVKRRDEAAHGEYRTKRVILEVYDAMQQAIESGSAYETRLDPPPADPRVAHAGPLPRLDEGEEGEPPAPALQRVAEARGGYEREELQRRDTTDNTS
jgi:hypothetical protein